VKRQPTQSGGVPPPQEIKWAGAIAALIALAMDTYVIVKGLTPFLRHYLSSTTLQSLAGSGDHATATKTVIFAALPLTAIALVTNFFSPRVSVVTGFLALLLAGVCCVGVLLGG